MTYHMLIVQCLGTWEVTLSRTVTAQDREQGLEPWIERAWIPAKPGRDADLDAMSAMEWALDEWFRFAAERTP